MRCEALEVVGAVPGDAALAAGWWQQLTLLVEADRVDRHVGPARQLLDSDVGVLTAGAASAIPMSADSRSSCSRGHTQASDHGRGIGE